MPVDADLPLSTRLAWWASFALERLTPRGGGAAKCLERGRGTLIARLAAEQPRREAPDAARDPLLACAGALETESGPGDVLWFPPLCGRSVRNLTPLGISASGRSTSLSKSLRSSLLPAVLRAFARHPGLSAHLK